MGFWVKLTEVANLKVTLQELTNSFSCPGKNAVFMAQFIDAKTYRVKLKRKDEKRKSDPKEKFLSKN